MFQESQKMVYEELAEDARRHLDNTSLSKIARIPEYDATRESHNFDTANFDANPTLLSEYIVRLSTSLILKKSPSAVDSQIARPFLEKDQEIDNSLSRNKLMVVTGHQTSLEPAVVLCGIQRAVAMSSRKVDHAELASRSHLIATKVVGCIDIFGKLPLVSLAQRMSNVYLTFPVSETSSAIDTKVSGGFKQSYNLRAVRAFMDATRGSGNLASIAPSATGDKIEDDGSYRIPRVAPVTQKLVSRGWDILPVASCLKGENTFVIPGAIVPSSEVSAETVHDAMEWIAQTRTDKGVPTSYTEQS